MRPFYPFLISLFFAAACHSRPSMNELPRLSWQPIDSVFAYYLEQGGGQSYQRGDLLGIQLIGGIDKKNNAFVPLSSADSAYAETVTRISTKILSERLAGKIKKNAEGYIRADLARLFPDQTVVITAYLSNNTDTIGLDSLTKYIDRLPEVSEQHYVSKEEAKKQFLANGNPDFTAVLDSNPLPASIEITVREEYVSKDTLLGLKQKLEFNQPLLISEVRLPTHLYTELRKVKVQDCVFHFKT